MLKFLLNFATMPIHILITQNYRKIKENTQLRCELINDDSVEADAEILTLIVDSLKAAGLKEF